MNISSATTSFSTTSFSSLASIGNRPPQGPSPEQRQEDLAAALKSVGVDDTTATDVLSQVQVAVDNLNSTSASGAANERSIRNAVAEVLEANGIDAQKIDAAIKSNPPPGPPPPRGPKPSDDESSSVESALLASNVDESNLDKLLSEMLDAISKLNPDEASSSSDESVRAALAQVLEENGVDLDLFERALGEQLGASGTFFNRVA